MTDRTVQEEPRARFIAGDDDRDGPDGPPSRSSFVLVGLAGVSALLGVIFLGYTVRYVQRGDPQGRTSAPKRISLAGIRFTGSVSDPISYDMGDTGVVTIVLVRQGRGLVALEQTCTHLGCQVAWQPANRRFSCPCHGSQFAMDGSVVAGPAVYPLYRHRLLLESTAVTIEGRV